MFSSFYKIESVVKKSLASILAVIAISTLAFSQSSNQSTVNISLTVMQTLSITEIGTLNFGTAYSGYAVPPVNPKTASNIPLFTVSGEPNAAISIPLSFNSTTVPFTPTVSGNQTNDQAGSTTLTLGTVSENLSSAGSGNLTGNYFLWLGGHVNNDNPLPSIPSGVYNGTYTVQVDY